MTGRWRWNRFLAVFLSMLPFVLTGCKESPRKPIQRSAKQVIDFDEVTLSIERLGGEGDEEPAAKPAPRKEVRTIDLLPHLESAESFLFEDKAPLALSHFNTDMSDSAVRVVMLMRGIPKGQWDNYDERIWELINARAPQPWSLQRAKNMEKNEKTAARLTVSFKRRAERLRRVTKSAPQRTLFQFDVKLSMTGLQPLESSWQNWTFHWEDEALSSAEKVVQEQFWKALEAAMPALTAIDYDAASHWILAHGLSSKILHNTLNRLSVPARRYYANGCLLSRESSSDGGSRYILRSLYHPYAPPQAIDVGMIEDMRCTRDAYYILSYETSMRLGLYYQPSASANVWKSMISVQEPIQPGGSRLYMDDDVICLWPSIQQGQTRSLEVHCLDKKTGLSRWKTKSMPGAFRGFAHDDRQLVFATDQMVAALSRDGEILDARRIETHSRRRAMHSCQLGNRLIFTRAPGAFVAYNLDEHLFDWQYSALEPAFIHCSRDNTFILSESGGYLLALDVENDKPMWKFRTSSVPYDALTFGGVVYFLLDRAILALDRATGHRVAEIPLPWRATKFIQSGANIYIDAPDAVYRWSN